MSDNQVFQPSAAAKARTLTTKAQYEEMYARSIKDPDGFWAEQAKRLDWFKFPTKIKNTSFEYPNISIKWFEDGELNVSYNCLDRHLEKRGDQTAIIWEGDIPGTDSKATYRELYERVCRYANVLKANGVRKGDRVTIYMPMVIDTAVAMLACARIGAIHSVIFGGFSAESIAGRVNDCDSRIVLTADEGRRGGKLIPLKKTVDEALAKAPGVTRVIVTRVTGNAINMQAGRDVWYHDEAAKVGAECPPERMNAEDPLFILYTSGSTGKPKGVLHTTGGYLVWGSMTHERSFDYRDGDVFWCTADVGWVTGHTYIVYGPLANGATTLMFEGIPSYPDAGRCWQVVEKHKVNIFHTAPTAIRALMGAGPQFPDKYEMPTLRTLGTVGEPINPEAWLWYYKHVGKERCSVVDAWWQTETGGHMITPLPVTPLKPGSCTLPLPGIIVDIVDETGLSVGRGKGGILVIKRPWPSMIRTIWGDPERFRKSYYPEDFKGKYYLAGDGASTDEDGYFRIMGRIDDVLNVSGHRLGTMEIESALVANSKLVAEAAVVGRPDELTGEAVVAFVVPKGPRPTGEDAKRLAQELREWVAKEIGAIAKPRDIRFGDNLPKTRSGKIMRRLLRSIAKDEDITQDISTLENPAILEQLKKNQ